MVFLKLLHLIEMSGLCVIFGKRVIFGKPRGNLWAQVEVSSAYHPQTDEQEVINRSLGNLLRCLVEEKLHSWDLILPTAEFAYNSLINRSTDRSTRRYPFEIVTGRRPRQPIDLMPFPVDKRSSQEASEFARLIHDIHHEINNAGSNAYSYKPLSEASDEDLIEVVTTNTLGLMICCREAIKMMSIQARGGHIFNIDGAGSDGRPTPRFAAYGATKRSVVHLTKSLQAELRMQDVNNVLIHNLSPGMVTTDLLMSGANTKQAKFFINVLAEPADVVAEYLVPGIRAIPTNGSTKPTYIRFLTGLKAYSQIFSRLAFGARRNRYVLED